MKEVDFWSKVDRNGAPRPGMLSPCWEWRGATISSGYGTWRPDHKTPVLTHRWSWAEANGPIPQGLFVLHACDNPPCVNPMHLFVGTQSDNMIDMVSKGRGRLPPPSTHRNTHKVNCPLCGGPFTTSRAPSQGGRRHCSPCTRARRKVQRAMRRQEKVNAARMLTGCHPALTDCHPTPDVMAAYIPPAKVLLHPPLPAGAQRPVFQVGKGPPEGDR